MERTGAGSAGLRAQDSLQESAAGTFGRHRFRSDRGDRGRRSGPGERAGGHDAIHSIRAKAAWMIRWNWRAIWASRSMQLPISPIMDTYEKTLAGAFTGYQARRDRGEYPVADSRQPAHGAVQQIRRVVAHHREQVRTGGRVLYPVRRHEWRTGGDRGPAEDDGVSGLAVPQPAKSGHPGIDA